MPEPKTMIKHALVAAATACAIFIGYSYIGGYAQALSIELALQKVLYLGTFQTVLGELFTGLLLGLIAAVAFFLLRLQPAVTYIAFGLMGYVAASFALVPAWPSNNHIRVIGELTFVLAAVAVAWAVLQALESVANSRGSKSSASPGNP